jgi:AAA domain-containing protein
VDTGAILRCFADLAERKANGPADDAPHGDLPLGAVDITRAGEAPVWLGTSIALPLAAGESALPSMPRTDAIRNLATLDRLQPAGRLLRLGWVIVTGRVRVGDQNIGYCFPLVSQPVVLDRNLTRGTSLTLRPVGEMELTPLVGDADRGARLEQNPQFGGGALDPGSGSEITARLPRLQSWIREVVAACGLPPVAEILAPDDDPLDQRSRLGLVACVGSLLYASRDVSGPPLAAPLREWAAARGIGGTAFAAVYGHGQPAPVDAHDPLDSPFPLSPVQLAAASRPRHERLTVVSGPPGSGKTHTVAAIAVDAVSRGWSVLLAAPSAHAADAVTDVLAGRPGPVPIRFGRAQDDDVATSATEAGTTNAQVRAAENALAEARARQAMVERAVADRLEHERQAAAATGWDTVLPELTEMAPRAFHAGTDPARLAALLDRAQDVEAAGWWRRTRARWAEGRLRRAVRADVATPLTELALAVRAARDRRIAAELAAAGGTTLATAYAELDAADDDVLTAAGELAAVRSRSEQRRRRGRAAGTGADLGALLRAGRRQRRRLLRTIDAPALVSALPLWVGTVADADDLLPRVPGLFDLVILDDAGQIDQIAAAGSLLRGARAVVVGDPRQLRHLPSLMSVTDEAVSEAVSGQGLEAHASRLDVRRASVFDVAAGATSVSWLDEHHRSVPHLIEFSARRFYEGRMTVATRRPSTESARAIDTVHVDVDAPDAADQAKHEVTAALGQIERLSARGRHDIGVITPFREVADALQAAVMERYDLDDVDRLGLRVGTVEAFRGCEADNIVLVLGLAPGDPVNRRRFVEDPYQFNVMVTRARSHMVVVTSLPRPTVATPAGLVDSFLAHADRASGRRAGAPSRLPSPWVASLVDELRALGVTAQAGYRVGRWTVELCAGDALAVETAVDPDGVDAHLERHRALRRVGWRTFDGYPSRWDGDAARAAADIAEAAQA